MHSIVRLNFPAGPASGRGRRGAMTRGKMTALRWAYGLAGVTFFVTAMLLPLVGPAGAATSHAAQNARTFGLSLGVTVAACGWAAWLAWRRRTAPGVRVWPAAVLLVIALALAAALAAGALRA